MRETHAQSELIHLGHTAVSSGFCVSLMDHVAACELLTVTEECRNENAWLQLARCGPLYRAPRGLNRERKVRMFERTGRLRTREAQAVPGYWVGELCGEACTCADWLESFRA